MPPTKPNVSFIVLTVSVFLVLLLPKMFQEGMFMDGLIYSSIANNLAKGEGTFWFPKFSETVMSEFHEHPPLAMGIQSLIFKTFGNDFYIEKIYSGFTALLTALFIVLIWRKINKDNRFRKLYWLPVLFWITIPEVFFSYNNNLLENTMGLFSISAVYLLLISTGLSWRKRIVMYVAVSILLGLSFLSKGFPGLYPLAFFVCHYLARTKTSGLRPMISGTAWLALIFTGLAALFLVSSTNAFASLSDYIDTQVITSLEGRGRVGPRLALLYDLLQQLVIIMLICAAIILSGYKRFTRTFKEEPETGRIMLFFFLIGLSASVPLMISPKLSPFYLVPSLPFFSIALALLIADLVSAFLERMKTRRWVSVMVGTAGYGLIAFTVVYSAMHYGNSFRDKEMIGDIHRIGAVLPAKSTISVAESLSQEWSLMGYFQRKFQINLDPSGTHNKYLLIDKNRPAIGGYEEIELRLSKYKLFKKLTAD